MNGINQDEIHCLESGFHHLNERKCENSDWKTKTQCNYNELRRFPVNPFRIPADFPPLTKKENVKRKKERKFEKKKMEKM